MRKEKKNRWLPPPPNSPAIQARGPRVARGQQADRAKPPKPKTRKTETTQPSESQTEKSPGRWVGKQTKPKPEAQAGLNPRRNPS